MKRLIIYIMMITLIVTIVEASEKYFLGKQDLVVEAFNKTDFKFNESQLSVWGVLNDS